MICKLHPLPFPPKHTQGDKSDIPLALLLILLLSLLFLLMWRHADNFVIGFEKTMQRILLLLVHQHPRVLLDSHVVVETRMRHFFFTAMLFVYGRILSQRFVNMVATYKVLYKLVSRFIKYHMVTCYFLYISGFMWFILTLKKKVYKYQFVQYAWTHMILIVMFTQSSFIVANIFEGIFWFFLPASLIIINDIALIFLGFSLAKLL